MYCCISYAGAKENGEWKMMNYRSYYENVRLAAKGFIKVKVNNKMEFYVYHTCINYYNINV